MKKAIILILALLIASPKSHAFEPLPKNDINFQYSTITGPQIASVFVGVFATAFSLGTYTLDEIKSTGMFSVQYYHSLGKRFMVGCSTGYEYLALILKDKNGAIRDGDVGNHFISLLPSVKFYYINNPHFSAYAKLQGGLLMMCDRVINEDQVEDRFDVGTGFAIQAVPFGMEFGGESLRGYVEAAYGSQGLLAVGIRKSF